VLSGGATPSRSAFYLKKSGAIQMLISLLITLFVGILVLYFISLVPLGGRGKQIARAVVIVLGIVSALKFLPVF
jgi:hypothetical protein